MGEGVSKTIKSISKTSFMDGPIETKIHQLICQVNNDCLFNQAYLPIFSFCLILHSNLFYLLINYFEKLNHDIHKWPYLNVSKFQKQTTKFSHPPKNQRNFVHFFALVSKSGQIEKLKALYCVKQLLITNSNHQMPLFFVSTTFQRIEQKNVQNFIGFLEDGRTWYFAFDIY